MGDHRRYPGAIFEWKGRPKGLCKWCGTFIYRRNGVLNALKSWHPLCVQQFKIRAWSIESRRFVFHRDGGKCAKCGTKHQSENSPTWELEHERPLAMADGDRSFWEPSNIRIYCKRPCHIEKTTRDKRLIQLFKESKDQQHFSFETVAQPQSEGRSE